MSVLAMLLSLAYSIGLILYILIDKNNIQVLMIIKMLGRVINSCIISIIYAKRAKNQVFGHFVKFGWFDGSWIYQILHILIDILDFSLLIGIKVLIRVLIYA